MYYVIRYRDRNSVGAVKLRIPELSSDDRLCVEQLDVFVESLNEFNRYFKKKRVKILSKEIEK